MKNQKIEIDALRALLETQLQVLALTVVVTHKGSATFLEQELCSSLPDAVQGVVTPMAMAVGGSVQSILELSSGPAGSIRDCYRPRSVDALRPYLAQIEAHILEQAGIVFDAKAAPGALRVVAG